MDKTSSPKYRSLFTNRHGVTFQNTWITINAAVRPSNLAVSLLKPYSNSQRKPKTACSRNICQSCLERIPKCRRFAYSFFSHIVFYFIDLSERSATTYGRLPLPFTVREALRGWIPATRGSSSSYVHPISSSCHEDNGHSNLQGFSLQLLLPFFPCLF
jgi:hypothetical protein